MFLVFISFSIILYEGTVQSGGLSQLKLMLTNKNTVEAGEEFTIDLYGVDLENVNAFGAVLQLDTSKYEYVGVEGTAYTSGMSNLTTWVDPYLTISFGNRGDKALVSGSHTLATITLRAREAGDALTMTEAMLIGPDNSLKICTNEAGEFPEVPPATTTTQYGQSDFDITMTNDKCTCQSSCGCLCSVRSSLPLLISRVCGIFARISCEKDGKSIMW